MAYSETSDIQSLIKWVTFSASSKVTLTELGNYINDADVIIDSKLERIYSVPITNSDDIDILKYISARLAASEVAQVLVLQASGQIPPVVRSWIDSANERLDLILDGTIDLPNSAKLSSNKGLYSYCANDNTSDDFESNTPKWTINGDEW